MAVDDANTVEEIGDDTDNFEGAEDLEDSLEEKNAKMAFYDEENPAYQSIDDSDESSEELKGFQEGVESDDSPAEEWMEEE